MNETAGFSLSEIEDALRKTLSPSRYLHSLGVRYTAAALAVAHDADLKKAELAGLLHDCAKGLSQEELLRIFQRCDLELRPIERENPALLHAKAGAVLAQEEFGVTDEEILNAIRSHTTGMPGMSLLSQIVFLADFMEPGRKMCSKLPEIRKLAFEDLDLACYTVLREMRTHLAAQNMPADERSGEAFSYYEQIITKQS